MRVQREREKADTTTGERESGVPGGDKAEAGMMAITLQELVMTDVIDPTL
ncbi:MAG: hypothetical protein R3281_06545 [Balneolaceae bacterium]|nr:hypothetical protein [Balneolaceae bacterium]